MPWWRRRDRPEPEILTRARADLEAARDRRDEYAETVSLEMERLAVALRRSMRPATGPPYSRRRPNGVAR